MLARDVKEEYENEWLGSIKWIEQRHAQGVTNPAQIVNEYNSYVLDRFFNNPNFGSHYFAKNSADAGKTLLVRNGAYVLSDEREYFDRVIAALVELASKHADRISDIVELGSGIGRNMFLLCDALAERNIKHIKFHACEYTESGRRATEILNAKNQGYAVQTHPFDYYHPDFTFLENAKGVLFFSVLSIEQITQMPAALIDEMIRTTSNCYCIHFEPIGWQYDPACVKFRARHDSFLGRWNNIFSAIKSKCLRLIDKKFGTALGVGVRTIPLASVVIGASENVSLNAARWSALQQYNRNFVEVLHAAQDQKKIAITAELVNTMSINPFNPTTIVSWKSCRSEG